MEELKLKGAFYLFLLSAAYIFLKRFYFFEIVYYSLFAGIKSALFGFNYILKPLVGFMSSIFSSEAAVNSGGAKSGLVKMMLCNTFPSI